jgi:hypothetical protein
MVRVVLLRLDLERDFPASYNFMLSLRLRIAMEVSVVRKQIFILLEENQKSETGNITEMDTNRNSE